MRTAAVLPVKSFARAKQRLGDVVGGGDREELAAAMVTDVLTALTSVAEIDDVVVVTAEPLAARAAEKAGAAVVNDPDEVGQSAAVSRGIDAALERGAERALLVPGDCPAVDPEEVAKLLARTPGDPSVVIVPDRHGSGTNALLLTPPGAVPVSFGAGSFARHAALARAAGATVKVCDLPLAGARRRHPRRPRGAPLGARRPTRRRRAHPRGARPPGAGGLVVTLAALPDISEIRPGDDLATILGAAAGTLDGGLRPDDVLAVAHKVVSKAEGRIVRLAEVFPGWEAHQLAKEHDKDPHLMQVILDESHDLVRADRGRLICRTRHGFVCANAGVDRRTPVATAR